MTDAELADPEYMRAYVESQNESFSELLQNYRRLCAQAVPEGYKLVPIHATREICCAIEARIENMIEASAMCCEMHRLDGDYIWDAAIAAVKSIP